MPGFGCNKSLQLISLTITLSASILFSAAAQQQTQAPTTTPISPVQQPKPPIAKPKKPVSSARKTAEAASDEKARLVEKIKDWTVFMHEDANGRICFAATMPTDTQPKTAKRANVIFYLTNWQKDGIKNEISIKQGYALKPNSPATATIGSASFNLIGNEDKTYVKDPNDEQKIVIAMSSGGVMTVKTTNAKSVTTTDQYSLNGLPDAVKKLNEVCP